MVHTPPARESRHGGSAMLVAVLSGGLGLLAGFTFGHTRCLHETVSSANSLLSRVPVASPGEDCAEMREAATTATRSLDAALHRLTALEKASFVPQKEAVCPTCPECPAPLPVKAAGVSEEELEHVAALEERVEELVTALRDTQNSSSTGGVDDDSWKQTTAWRDMRAVDGEKLWKFGLGSIPYAGISSRNAILLTKKPRPKTNNMTHHGMFYGSHECQEIDYVIASNKPGVCLAIYNSQLPVYSVLRVDGTRGTLTEAVKKKLAPQKHVPWDAEAWSDAKVDKRAAIISQAGYMPKVYAMQEALETTSNFGSEVPRLVKGLRELIKKHKIARNHDTVVVMATNVGTLDLVANFACSARAVGLHDALNSVLVFTTDDDTSRAVERIGLAAYNDKALGDLPVEAARAYGDYSFVRMMWLKVTSVFLVCQLKHSVLFQDADIVWLKDPIQYFWAPSQDLHVDTYWMDDGARSQRYAPLFTNSGFYFLRSNERTLFFVYKLLMSYDIILAVRSHQHALIMLLIDHMARYSLTVNILSPEEFPQGHVFHHRKEMMQGFVEGNVARPWIFHMCWTASRIEKVRYLKNLGLWYLQPGCEEDCTYEPRYCLDTQPFQVPTPFTTKIDLNSKLAAEDTYKPLLQLKGPSRPTQIKKPQASYR